jgi:hypothetical protein
MGVVMLSRRRTALYARIKSLLLRHYRVVTNSLLLMWLLLGTTTIFVNNPVPIGIAYVTLIFITMASVAYIDCRTCPKRLGNCTHYYLGRLTIFMPKKDPETRGKSFWHHFPLIVLWSGIQLSPQYWLWQSMVLFALSWLLPITVLIFQRSVVCWQMCGNKDCPLNKQFHPFPWEVNKLTPLA